MKSRVAFIVSAVALVAMCVLIFVMSAFPAEDSDALSTGVIWHIVGFIVPGYDQLSAAEQLRWQEALQFPVRKTAHFLEYALLGALALNLVMRMNALCAQPLQARQAAHTLQPTQVTKSAETPLPVQDPQSTRAPLPMQDPQSTQPPHPKSMSPSRQAFIAWAFSTAYAITDEIHQMFVPGRSGELRDVCIDAAGSLLGVAIVLLIVWLVGKRRARKRADAAPE